MIMRINKKIICVMSMICFSFAVLLAAENPPGGGDGFNKLEFKEKVIDTTMVVNDVLYAGLSKYPVDTFVPVLEDISPQDHLLFKENKEKYETGSFYVYGMASSTAAVSIGLRYSNACTQQSDPSSLTGMMYCVNNKTIPGIPVKLVSNVPLTSLPLIITVTEKAGENIVVSNAKSSSLLWLEVLKSDIQDRADLEGIFRVELVLEIIVDGARPQVSV